MTRVTLTDFAVFLAIALLVVALDYWLHRPERQNGRAVSGPPRPAYLDRDQAWPDSYAAIVLAMARRGARYAPTSDYVFRYIDPRDHLDR